MGGKVHLKLNTDERPIANKYREGKMKRTLKRELKVLEIVNRESIKFKLLINTNQLDGLNCFVHLVLVKVIMTYCLLKQLVYR